MCQYLGTQVIFFKDLIRVHTMRSESELNGRKDDNSVEAKPRIFIHNAKKQWGTWGMGRKATRLTHEVSQAFFWLLGVMVAACRSFNKHIQMWRVNWNSMVPNMFLTFNRNWLWSKNIVLVVPFLDIVQVNEQEC